MAYTRQYSRRYDYRERDRLYDCCTGFDSRRPPPQTQPHNSTSNIDLYASTYGTYIYPIDTKRYATTNTSDCTCRCCPHSLKTARLDSGGDRHFESARRRHDSHRDRAPSGARKKHSTDDSQSHRSGRHYQASHDAGGRRSAKDRITVQVMDRTHGRLSGRNGKKFSISVKSTAAPSDIADFLVGDKRCFKVVVRWEHGAVEPFDELIDIRELDARAARLELRMKKTVHWSSRNP